MTLLGSVDNYKIKLCLTCSPYFLGKFDRYRFVEPGSPSALRRELNDSYDGLVLLIQKY